VKSPTKKKVKICNVDVDIYDTDTCQKDEVDDDDRDPSFECICAQNFHDFML